VFIIENHRYPVHSIHGFRGDRSEGRKKGQAGRRLYPRRGIEDIMILSETTEIIRALYGQNMQQITIERMVLGLFFGGVKLSNGCGGISYMPTSDIHENNGCESMSSWTPRPGTFRGTPVSQILDMKTSSPLLGTIQLLVLNALSSLFFTKDRYRITYDSDVLDNIDTQSIKKVAMIGAITPFIKIFKNAKNIKFHVIEKKKQSLREDERKYYVPAEKAAYIIPLCDTVIITGATVANGTIEELLRYVKSGTKVIVTGPTVSFLPDALFKRHVDIVSGTMVTAVDKTLDMLAEGAGAYHLFEASCLRKINIIRNVRNDTGRP